MLRVARCERRRRLLLLPLVLLSHGPRAHATRSKATRSKARVVGAAGGGVRGASRGGGRQR